jgi:hypothetical protein
MANENQNFVAALSQAAIRFQDEAEKMLRNYFAQVAPEASLESLGRDRLVPRYPQETQLSAYRTRVINAWDENVGRGGYQEIIRVIEGYGFTFAGYWNGFDPGFDPGDPLDSFNLLLPVISVQKYDGTYQYDGVIKYDAVGPNEILIQIKRLTGNPVPDATKAEITAALKPIVRASIRILAINEIFV